MDVHRRVGRASALPEEPHSPVLSAKILGMAILSSTLPSRPICLAAALFMAPGLLTLVEQRPFIVLHK